MHRRSFLGAATASVAAAFTPFAAAGGTQRNPRGYIRTNWSADPFSFGSYSFTAKGARRKHHVELGRPVGERLFFAGEATHPDYNSTIHAAFESGQIAAERVADTSAKRIAVIGAGMSGLSAAASLAEAGRTVTLFEARDRIGGRVWTDDRLGVPLDLGASWIHGIDGNPMVEQARRANAETYATGDDYILRGADGRVMSDAEAPDWLDEVASIEQSFGAARDEINMRAYWLSSDYDGIDVVLPGGVKQLLPSLPDGQDVRLNEPIEAIAYSDAGVRLISPGGQSFDFEAVIVTVPLGVLKAGALRFDPPLPPIKRDAIGALGMGLLDKVYLLYDEVFWDAETTWILTPETGLPRGQFNQWLNFAPIIGAPVIMAFNGAGPARALSRMADQDVIETARRVLAATYPG